MSSTANEIIQISCNVMSIILAIPTLIYLKRAYRAADRQANAADKQATAAESATLTAQASLDAMKLQNDLLLAQRRDAVSPNLIIVTDVINGFRNYFVENQGSGAANHIELRFESLSTPIRLGSKRLGAGFRTQILQDMNDRNQIDDSYELRYSGGGGVFRSKGMIAGISVIQQSDENHFPEE